MKSYNKILFSGLIALVAGAFFVGCTDVDDTLGGNLIPGDMEMEIGSDDFGETTLKTFIIGNDSIISSKQNIYIIGSTQSDVYGSTQASTVMQFWPTGTKLDVGAPLTIDSALIYVSMVDYAGKGEQQEFGFHEIVTPINRDSVYSVFYDQLETAGTYDTDPMFTIKLSKDSIGLVKLDYGQKGADFLKKVIIDELSATYESNSAFLDKYQGFYIKKTDNALYAAKDGVFGLYAPYTEIDVYVHYTDPTTETVVNKVVPMTCSDGSSTLGNMSINKIKHDYTTAISQIQGINDTLPTSAVRNPTYVQGLAGLSTVVRFDDSFIAEIEALKADAQTQGFSYVSINKAEIVFSVNEYDGPNKLDILNNAPTRFGMYYAFKSNSMIIDYNETSSDLGSSFDGYLNRAKGTYTMNITNYLQLLLKNPTTMPRDITVAPSWGLSGLSFRDVQLMGSGSAKPPKVKITYTLVK